MVCGVWKREEAQKQHPFNSRVDRSFHRRLSLSIPSPHLLYLQNARTHDDAIEQRSSSADFDFSASSYCYYYGKGGGSYPHE
jgi:hypothetical protein